MLNASIIYCDLDEQVAETINDWLCDDAATAEYCSSEVADCETAALLEIIIEHGERVVTGNVSIKPTTSIVVLYNGTIATCESWTEPTGGYTYTGDTHIPTIAIKRKLLTIYDDKCERIALLISDFESKGCTTLDVESIAVEIADTAIELHKQTWAQQA